MSNRRQGRVFGYENLERKCLMAADVVSGLMAMDGLCGNEPVDTGNIAAEVCQIQCDANVETLHQICAEDLAETPSVEDGCEAQTDQDTTEVAEDVASCAPATDLAPTVTEDSATPLATNLDVSDGTDGAFVSFDETQSSANFELVAPNSGRVDLIISTDFENADTVVKVSDQDGNLVFHSETPAADGFVQLGFMVEAEQAYQIELSAEGLAEGDVQLTANFEADDSMISDELGSSEENCIAEPVELNLDQTVGVVGELDCADDVDTIHVTAPADGEISIAVQETTQGHEEAIEIAITDLDGRTIAEGLTNDMVNLKANVQGDQTYAVSILGSELTEDAGYQIAISHTAEVSSMAQDLHADCIGDDGTEIQVDNGIAVASGLLETGEDRDAFRFTADHDGMNQLEFSALSPDSASQLSVGVYSDDGQLIQESTSNRDLAIDLMTNAGKQYHILVDSTNDVSATYWMNSVASEGILDSMVMGDSVPVDIANLNSTADPFAEVDAWFSEFGEPLSAPLA